MSDFQPIDPARATALIRRPDMNINYDRGVVKSSHPKLHIDIYMYADEPGVYLNALGKPVPDDMAKEAGFDVEKLAKKKLYRERMALASAALEAELEEAPETRQVLFEQGGLRVVAFGDKGMCVVEDGDGQRLTKQPVTEAQARALVGKLVPTVPEAAPVAPAGPAPAKKA